MSTGVSMRTVFVARDPADTFFEQLCRARQRLLLLDYDGTIAPFSVQRNRAFPYPTIPELLDSIMSTCRTRVLLISGRAAQEIPPLLGLNPHPEIWGAYGAERLHPGGDYFAERLSDETEQALAEAEALLGAVGLGVLVERKAGAVAVHWRGIERARMEEVKTAAYRALWPLALRHHLLLAEFDGGLELRQPLRGKGDVVRAVLADYGPEVAAAYLGDDTTDEDAFRAISGRGLSVLVRPSYRFTAAQTWLRPPEELVAFLTDWVRSCGGDM